MQGLTPELAIMLRPAAESEFETVAVLFAELHAFNAGLDQRFRLADDWHDLLHAHFLHTHQAPGALWLLAWVGTQAAGLLLIEAHHDSPLFAERRWAELVALYVLPAFRGSQLARQLLEAGKRWAAAQGFDRLQLYVTASNQQARRFYARCGLYPTQEIWRADLQPLANAVPPADPSCEPAGHAEYQVELGHHQFAMELDAHRHPQPPADPAPAD